MKKRYLFIGSIVALLSVASVSAQQVNLGGKLTRFVNFSPSDMANMSQYNYGFGTARSSAMGGAFASLGADLSSMSINPAGLGMYRGSEFGMTFAVNSSNTNSMPQGGSSVENTKSQFSVNNMGIAFNVYQGTGALTSFTFGFAYNKLADFNYNTGIRLADQWNGQNSSLLEVFKEQLNYNNYNPDALSSKRDPWNNLDIDVLDWGAVLSYQTGAIADINDRYETPDWSNSTLSTHYLKNKVKGSIGEYDISGGMNFNNKFYFGFTVGIQDIYYEERNYYDEQYSSGRLMNYMLYDQGVKMVGTGVNLKLGAIARPIDGLRIGLALHTPTMVSLNRQYNASMSVDYDADIANNNPAETVNSETNSLVYDYNFNTPTRLLAGISYTVPRVGIIAVDYERAWYNGMRLTNEDSYEKEALKEGTKDMFKGVDNLRVGLELKPTQSFSIRAGYAIYGQMMRDDLRWLDSPVTQKGYNISAGLGYRHKGFSIDAAYVYMSSTLSNYDLYSYQYTNNGVTEVDFESPGLIKTTRNRNNVSLSLGFRF